MARKSLYMPHKDCVNAGLINRRHWQTLLYFTFLACQPVLANQTIAGKPVSAAETNRPQVLIVVRPVQNELMGPNPRADSSMWNLIPYVGNVIDSALAYSRSIEDVEGIIKDWQEMSGAFNFRYAVLNGIANLDRSEDWRIAEITEYEWAGPTDRMAQRLIRTEGYDYVFFTEFIYFITPGFDQIRIWFSLQAYSRLLTPQHIDRNYEYLSQSRGDLFRPFLAGEKEALIEAVENQYKLKLEQFPNNRKAYRKDRKEALNALNSRDVILPIMAINEGWPGNSFPAGLQLATDNILAMMQEDLLDNSEDQTEDLEYIAFNGFDLKGNSKEFEGQVVGKQGLNTMYRDSKGNMYSVP